jgi:hypothetical protein
MICAFSSEFNIKVDGIQGTVLILLMNHRCMSSNQTASLDRDDFNCGIIELIGGIKKGWVQT